MELNDTDLSLGNGMGFVVLQPIETEGMKGVANMDQPDKWALNRRIINGLQNAHRFVHVGNFSIATAKEGFPCYPESREYHSCGGIIEVKRSDSRPEPKIECSLCPIDALFYHLKLGELPDLLLHLLMKQMFPNLPTCNYFYCEPDKPGGELGMMAVAEDILGLKRAGSLGFWTASLGFVLMPGMRVLDSFGGFDTWARFLVELKFEQIRSSHESLLPALIGEQSKRRREHRYYW